MTAKVWYQFFHLVCNVIWNMITRQKNPKKTKKKTRQQKTKQNRQHVIAKRVAPEPKLGVNIDKD